MAYVEVWKSGKLITRRRVDEQKARKGCRIRLGSAGEVRVAVGESKALGKFEIRMFSGEPPIARKEAKETLSKLPEDEQSPPFSADAPIQPTERRDRYPDIEGYKIIESLGEGGMGMVWRAEQLSTRREVALKLISSHRIDSPKAQARFEREVELTARLDHPNIARIYDSGLHRGTYYYAMELIDGELLDHYIKIKALSQDQILVLMRTICQAVHHAHLRGVIHRDLKPSNIIVGRDGQPHVVDFGLAKTFLEEGEALTISVEGQIAGTPAYMSPEQAAGHLNEIDTRSDVFSLGVILYQLLIGDSPHDLSGSVIDILEKIIHGKIRRPREINKSINRELESLLLKALAQDPEDRYASAGDLQDDIDNYLNSEPLRAQVPTTFYFLRKKVRKYRVQVGIGLAVSLVILGTILVAYTKIVAERAVQESQARELDLKSAKLTWAELELKALGKDRTEARAALQIIRDEYVSAQDEISQLNHKLGQRKPPVAVRRVDLKAGAALASTALVRKPSLPGAIRSWTLETYGHRGAISKLAYSPDGSQLASAGHDGIVRIWNAESGQLVRILVDPNGSTVDLPWFTDGRAAGRFSWSANRETPARTIDEIITLWDTDLPDVWRPLQRTAATLAMSPDRSMLAFGDRDGTIRVLNPKSGQLRHTRIPAWCGPVHSVRFSSDGKVLATCAGSGTVCLWDAHRWQPLRKFETDGVTDGIPPSVSTIAWGLGDTVIAKPNNQQDALEILDSQSGQVLRVLYGNGQKMACVSWSPDGTLLAAGTIDGIAYLWNVESDSNEPFVRRDAHSGSVNTLAWKPDDQSLITAGEDGKIKLWQPRTGKLTGTLERHTGPITCLAPSPDGRLLASGSQDGTIRLWDVEGRLTVNLLRNEPNDTETEQSAFTAVAWSPDDTLLASGDSVGNIQIWDPNSRQPKRSFAANCGSISSLAWSPDGRIIVCGGADGTARVWDVKNNFQEYLVLLPLWSSAGPGIAVGSAGDYRGPPGIADHLVYVAETTDGQMTLSPADFKSGYGWVNEPWQVGLYAPGSEEVQRIYVKADAEPPYDGSSWDTAFDDLQDALSIAQPDTEIWVVAGVYRPDRGTGARTASFHLKNGVRLLGGFAGTETSSHQRDPNNNETILSGDLKGDDGPDFANNDENSYHVVVSDRTDETAVLDGFIITGGNANGPAEYKYGNGGGIYNTAGGLTLINCTFRFNSAHNYGGGMYHKSGGSNLSLTACIFSNNRTVVAPQRGHGWGGGIHISGAKGKMINCVFEGNSSNSGAGVFFTNVPSFVLQDCKFLGNRSANSGGGILTYSENACSLVNCRFVGNSARLGGGGVLNGGESNATLANCLFVGNSTEHGGGGMLNSSSKHAGSYARLTNCTFMANSSRTGISGFRNQDKCGATLANCILWENTVRRDDDVEAAQIQGGKIVVNDCCIQGWSGKLGGTGNFGDDPLFVDPNGPDNKIGTLDDNLRVSLNSPCINAGSNSALGADTSDLDGDGDTNEPIPFDVEGKPRILNGVVDLGAYESG